ncbi:MAG: hypothetical protein JWN99_2725 [Ilumatobacteraceae bacterium]|nr:hypothetical protein [Ilumatobacteraceae bacterium]
MNDLEVNPELERRLTAALHELMPHLGPVDAQASPADHGRVLVAERTLDIVDLNSRRRHDGSTRRHRALGVAAGLLVVAGIGAAMISRSDQPQAAVTIPGTAPGAASVAVAPAVVPAETASDSLLTSAVPSDVQPLIGFDQPGWVIEAYSGLVPVPDATATATCAGCGVTRLIVAPDGPLFSGPIFTAWTIDDDYDLSEFDWPVTIGTTPGRFIGSADGSTPAAQNQVRVVWPLGPGRTAFVDAAGFTNDQVFAMAASLTFDVGVPTMASPPAGLSVRPTPRNTGQTTQMYMKFVNDEWNVEVYATNAGLQGLLDWRSPGGGSPIKEPWVGRSIAGTTVSFDLDSGEPPRITSLSATWVAGGWGYVVIGHVFHSQDEFADMVATMRLTDSATFAAATSGVPSVQLGQAVPSIDGSTAVIP